MPLFFLTLLYIFQLENFSCEVRSLLGSLFHLDWHPSKPKEWIRFILCTRQHQIAQLWTWYVLKTGRKSIFLEPHYWWWCLICREFRSYWLLTVPKSLLRLSTWGRSLLYGWTFNALRFSSRLPRRIWWTRGSLL